MNIFMRKITSVFKKRANSRGQSLVELALVLALLLFMVVAIIEYGFMLNSYLNILDAGREAARQSSLGNPFMTDGSGNVDPAFYTDVAAMVDNFLLPLTLDSASTSNDDILVSFFSIDNGVVYRYPSANTAWSRFGKHVTQLPDSSINALLNPSAPNTGILLIEIYYNYNQVLNLPIFSNVIPNPIPLYTYSVMPLSAAEPTPTP